MMKEKEREEKKGMNLLISHKRFLTDPKDNGRD